MFDERYYISADIDFILRCYQANVNFDFPPIILTNMTDGGVSHQFPIKKNIHDFKLRVNKFCKNPFLRIYYMSIFTVKFLLIKLRGKYL